ncbi:MAG: hypothetical protein SVY53_07005 [Chloroflexota bacterium]|nr:hypothetical protein [Chloroflexota bacterium]
MITVQEVNQGFAEKGLNIKLPLADNIQVSKIDIVEKNSYPGGVKVLLRVDYEDPEQGRQSELFFCETQVRRETKGFHQEIAPPPKQDMLPLREGITFSDDKEAREYLIYAITSLLTDKGYTQGQHTNADLYFEGEKTGFFINIAVRCDDEGAEKAKQLVELRRKVGSSYEYALVFPAIQEPLGLSLQNQERWIARNQDYLSVQRIGVYGVDNQDPNRVYSFTIYPKARLMRQYFMRISPQWPLLRSRYVQDRAKAKMMDGQ